MTATLAAEIKDHMIEDNGGCYTNCEDCGRSVTEEFACGHEGFCPRCYHRAKIEAARDELAEAREDLAGLMDEMADLRERIAEAKAAVKAAKGNLMALKK